MKKLFTASLLLISLSAFADCPEFKPHYITCQSDAADPLQAVKVRMRPPFYKFTFVHEDRYHRVNVITDGEPRDVTIQTQDGQEASYNESASCYADSMTIVRTKLESEEREEIVLIPSEEGLEIHHTVNGRLTTTKCSEPNW